MSLALDKNYPRIFKKKSKDAGARSKYARGYYSKPANQKAVDKAESHLVRTAAVKHHRR